MSIVDIHAELMQSLSSALDTSKILLVFTSLMTIIREQQEKIEAHEAKISYLASTGVGIGAGIPAGMEERLRTMEAALDEMKVNLHGAGNEDSSILHRKEMTGYLAFQTSGIGIVHGGAADDGEGSVVGEPARFDPTDALPPPEEETAHEVAQFDAIETVEDRITPTAEILQVDAPPPILAEATPRIIDVEKLAGREEVEAEAKGTGRAPTPSVPLAPLDESHPASDAVTPLAEDTAAPHERVPRLPVAEDEAVRGQGAVSRAGSARTKDTLSDGPPPISAPASGRLPSRPPSSRPKTPAMAPVGEDSEVIALDDPVAGLQSQSSRLSSRIPRVATPPHLYPPNELDSNIPLLRGNSGSNSGRQSPAFRVEVELARPRSSSPHAVNDSFTAPNPLSTNSRTYESVNPVLLSKDCFQRQRRKMSLSNLPFLSGRRLSRIVRELRRRGLHIRISREMLEDARKRYSNKSLKQKMEYIEMDLNRLRSVVNVLQAQVKKSVQTLKEKTSESKGDVSSHIELLLRVVDDFGGIGKLVSTLEESEQTAKAVKEMALETSKSSLALEKMRQHVLKEQAIALRDGLDRTAEEVKEELVGSLASKAEIDTMLTMPEVGRIGGGGRGGGGGFVPLISSKPQDANNVRLIAIINHALSLVNDRIDSFEKYVDKVFKERAQERLEDLDKVSRSGSSEYTLLQASQYTDEKVAQVARFVEQKVADIEARRGELIDELTVVKLKMEALDAKLKDEKPAEDPEAIRKEATAIRELQRRVANIPVDKLMEEMKTVQKDLRTRALATDVQERISSAEDGLRELLGENVVGLRSLLYEVFRHIQHKADRDDIRHLITAKLTQMEKELVRREEEMLSVASQTRCLSCGQLQASQIVHGHGGVAVKPGSVPGGGSLPSLAATTSASRSASPQHNSLVLDDDLSADPPPAHTQASTSSAQAEQVYHLLTGQAGLRPLHLQHPPLQPVKDPYGSTAGGHPGKTPPATPLAGGGGASLQDALHLPPRASTANAASRLRGKCAEKIPEPLYRKAQLSQHLKEMVKVTAPALQTQGYDLSNPLYVLDAYDLGPGHRPVSSAPLIVNDHAMEPPLTNPFTDLAQPLSFSSLPRGVAPHLAREMSKSTVSLGSGGSSHRARSTAGNVLATGDLLMSSTVKLHNSYT